MFMVKNTFSGFHLKLGRVKINMYGKFSFREILHLFRPDSTLGGIRSDPETNFKILDPESNFQISHPYPNLFKGRIRICIPLAETAEQYLRRDCEAPPAMSRP